MNIPGLTSSIIWPEFELGLCVGGGYYHSLFKKNSTESYFGF